MIYLTVCAALLLEMLALFAAHALGYHDGRKDQHQLIDAYRDYTKTLEDAVGVRDDLLDTYREIAGYPKEASEDGS